MTADRLLIGLGMLATTWAVAITILAFIGIFIYLMDD